MTGMHQSQRAQFTDDQLQQLQQVVLAAVQPLQAKIAELQLELLDVKHQLEHGDRRMSELSGGLELNNTSTAEMRDMFDTAKKGLRLIGGIGNGLKWLAATGGPLLGLWALWKGHR